MCGFTPDAAEKNHINENAPIKAKSDTPMLIINAIAKRLIASSFFSGRIIASSYLPVEKITIAETSDMYVASIPNSSGVYNRESTGDSASTMICETTVPDTRVRMFFENSLRGKKIFSISN